MGPDPPDARSGCSEPSGLIAVDELFHHFSGFPFLDLSFPVHCLLFGFEFFHMDDIPVLCLGSKPFVVGEMRFKTAFKVGAAIANVISVHVGRVEDVGVEHFGRFENKKSFPA
jgi:hypothetical protein